MAWSSSATAAHSDNPTFVVANAIELTSGINCRWNTTGTMTGTDLTHTDYPATRLFDRHYHVDTRPNTTATTWYLMMTADPTDVANTIVIAGHNLSGVTTILSTADNDAFTDRFQVIHNFGVLGSNDRVVHVDDLDYTGLTRLRLQLDFGSAFTPQISEFVYGKRIVLSNKPREPWDNQWLRSDVTRVKAKSGAVSSYSRNNGQRAASLSYWADDTTDISNVRTIFSGTNYGGKSFVYIDNPNTAPSTTTHFMVMEPEQNLPLVNGPHLRETTIDMEEVTPFYSSEA